jgi:hypothetical protein
VSIESFPAGDPAPPNLSFVGSRAYVRGFISPRMATKAPVAIADNASLVEYTDIYDAVSQVVLGTYTDDSIAYALVEDGSVTDDFEQEPMWLVITDSGQTIELHQDGVAVDSIDSEASAAEAIIGSLNGNPLSNPGYVDFVTYLGLAAGAYSYGGFRYFGDDPNDFIGYDYAINVETKEFVGPALQYNSDPEEVGAQNAWFIAPVYTHLRAFKLRRTDTNELAFKDLTDGRILSGRLTTEEAAEFTISGANIRYVYYPAEDLIVGSIEAFFTAGEENFAFCIADAGTAQAYLVPLDSAPVARAGLVNGVSAPPANRDRYLKWLAFCEAEYRINLL